MCNTWKLMLIVFVFGVPVTLKAEQQNNKPIDTLQQTLSYALSNNPGLAALQARYHAMEEISLQQAAIPEPRLSLNAVNLPIDSFALDKTPMTQIQIGISQNLPYPGKLALSQQSAQHEAQAVAANVNEARRQLTLSMTKLWWQLLYLEKALQSVKRNRELLNQFVEIAQTKYQIGQGQQQDVLLAQVEVSRLLDNESRLLSQRNMVQAQINSLAGRSKNQNITINFEVSEQLPEIDRSKFDLAIAEKQRPDFSQSRSQIAAARSRLDLAKKNYFPDFMLSAIYGWRETETDFANILFSMNLPINTASRQDPLRDQRNQELLQQQFQLQDMRNRLAAEIDIAIFNYEQAKNQSELYKNNILPQSRQTVEAMLAGYQVNKVDFLNLIRSQVTLFNYETQYWQAFSAAKQAFAELQSAMGQEIEHE